MHEIDSKEEQRQSFLFQVIVVLLNFLFLNESWKKIYYGFHKSIKQQKLCKNVSWAELEWFLKGQVTQKNRTMAAENSVLPSQK